MPFFKVHNEKFAIYDSPGIYGTVYHGLISDVLFLAALNFLLILLCSLQVFLILLALLALHGVGLIHLKPFSLRLAERLFVPAVCGSVQCVLAVWAEACSHSGLYSLIARFLPMVSVSLGHLFALNMPGSIHVSSLLTVLTFASVSITGMMASKICQEKTDVSLGHISQYFFFFFFQNSSHNSPNHLSASAHLFLHPKHNICYMVHAPFCIMERIKTHLLQELKYRRYSNYHGNYISIHTNAR